MLKFPEKLYLGVQGRAPLSVADYPLGFAIPFGDTKEIKKRLETVKNWTGGDQSYTYDVNLDGSIKRDARGFAIQIVSQNPPFVPHVIENVPIEGFSLEKVVSRWSTSNKWFRIRDPRGFTLEISSENLIQILLNGEIRQGDIMGRYIWAFGTGSISLVPESNEEYLSSTSGVPKAPVMIHNYYKTAYGSICYYLGYHYQFSANNVKYGANVESPLKKRHIFMTRSHRDIELMSRSSLKNLEPATGDFGKSLSFGKAYHNHTHWGEVIFVVASEKEGNDLIRKIEVEKDLSLLDVSDDQ